MKWPENMQIQEETYPEDPVWLQFIDNNINIVYIVVNSWCLQTQKIQKKQKWTFDGFDVRISKWDFLLRSNLRELQRTLLQNGWQRWNRLENLHQKNSVSQ